MPDYYLDPDRKRPVAKSCRNGAPCDCEKKGWRHASNWTEIETWLEHELLVLDEDGDKVSGISPVPMLDGPEVKHSYGLSGTDVEGYSLRAEQMLIEDVEVVPPATPEEEDEALASILDAFKSNRLS